MTVIQNYIQRRGTAVPNKIIFRSLKFSVTLCCGLRYMFLGVSNHSSVSVIRVKFPALGNFANYLPSNIAWRPRRLDSSTARSLETQIPVPTYSVYACSSLSTLCEHDAPCSRGNFSDNSVLQV